MNDLKINIHRGKNQIGGNIIEIATETTRILLDVGLEFDDEDQILPQIEGLFENADFDGVFISHYHGDHLGLAYYIDKQIPLYMGEASYRIVKTADEYKGVNTITPTGFFEHNIATVVGDIKITPYLCDHSAFDSYMFLCESDGERILYTGDFRSNGRKSFSRLLRCLPNKVNKLICEGTTLSRNNNISMSEAELEEKVVKIFQRTNGPIFVLQSSTNIDRIVTMYRAAKRSGRIFLEELYMAEITSAIGGTIPNPNFNDVYAYITNSKRYEALTKYKNRIGKEQMKNQQFVMCVRSSMLRYLHSLSEEIFFKEGILVYSMWSGYQRKTQMREFLDACEKMGLQIVELHTSGHADADTIRQLIGTVHPDEIIPVHTEAPEWFRDNIKEP